MYVVMAQAVSGALFQWFAKQLLARPFVLVVFALVFLYFLYFVSCARKEIHACRDWIDHGETTASSQIVGQIRLFLEESERWRIQGIAVPMTDYSDRIDSFIEGLSDHLHNAVNLFLIVGLAGTFFGMAEFARRAPDLQQLSDPKEVLSALQSALGHSFPIGFLGLCLTILGYPVASYCESRLREAAKNVVNHALRFRTAALRQDSSDALLDAVHKLPDALGTIVAVTQENLIKQLRPLLDIPEAIRQANEQAIGPLRELYAESRKEWKETVSKLNQHTKRMADSIEKLEAPIVALTAKIGQISGLVTVTQQAISLVLSAAERTADKFEQLRTNVDATVSSLHVASEELRRVPDSVRTDLSNLHDTLLRSIRAYYETLGSTYVESTRSIASGAVGEISTAVNTAGGKLLEAASSLLVAADAITPELRKAIAMGADHLRTHLDQFNDAFSQQFPKAVLDLTVVLAAASKQMESARQILDAMSASVSVAGKQAEDWSRIDRSLQQVHSKLEIVADSLSASASAIEASAEAHATVPPAIKASVSAIETAIGGLRRTPLPPQPPLPPPRPPSPPPFLPPQPPPIYRHDTSKTWFESLRDKVFGRTARNGS